MRMKIATNTIQLSTPTAILLPLLLLACTTYADELTIFDVGSGQEQALLSATVTNPTGPTTHMYAQPRSLSASDFGQFLATCPSLDRQVGARCRTSQLSCWGRCVEALGRRSPPQRAASCYCDPVCHVYKDCCWDVDHLCPGQRAEYERSFSHLADVAVICLDGSKVIDGCGAANNYNMSTDHNQPDHREHRDHREPMVVTEAGLFFTNRTTYYNCYKLSEGNESSLRNNYNNNDNKITFLDVGIHADLNRAVDRKILENFFLTGRKMDRAILKLNLFGKSQPRRECSRPFAIDCPAQTGNQRQGCRTKPLLLRVEEISCSGQTHEMNQSDGSGSSELVNDRGELPVTTTSRDHHHHHPLSLLPAKGDHSPRRGFSRPFEDPDSDLPCHIMRQVDSSTATMRRSHNIVVNFADVNKPDFNFNAKKASRGIVTGLHCPRDQPRDLCTPTANCVAGFIPVGLRCGQPRLLSIFVRGIRRWSAIKHAIGVLLLKLGAQPQFAEFTSTPPSFFRQMEVEDRPRSTLALVHLPIVDSHGLSSTSKQLSVTDDIVETLMKIRQISKTIYELTACFVMDIVDPEDTVLVCDTMVAASTGVIRLKRHFVVEEDVHNSTLKLAEFKRLVTSGTPLIADEGNGEEQTMPGSNNSSPSLMNAPVYYISIIISIIGHRGLITYLP